MLLCTVYIWGGGWGGWRSSAFSICYLFFLQKELWTWWNRSNCIDDTDSFQRRFGGWLQTTLVNCLLSVTRRILRNSFGHRSKEVHDVQNRLSHTEDRTLWPTLKTGSAQHFYPLKIYSSIFLTHYKIYSNFWIRKSKYHLNTSAHDLTKENFFNVLHRKNYGLNSFFFCKNIAQYVCSG
jgi:hypothetical protein